MISIVLYGRNDNYGYNLHKRAAISFNTMAENLDDPDDEILFVDYNTPNDFPTFPEAIQDTLTEKARRLLRVFRARPHIHKRYEHRTSLKALEPISRNIGLRRSNPANRWILSSNTDIVFVPRTRASLNEVAAALPPGTYGAPRLELPETLWESLDRREPRRIIETVREWGSALHLDELVYSNKTILYDAPGDFQLMLRSDLFGIQGFDESMLLGWHVDSNIAKRLTLLHGTTGDLGGHIFGYHCDHTRQITPMHRHGRASDDLGRFFHDVHSPFLPNQADTWGCADDEIEEVRLVTSSSHSYIQALHEIVGEPLQEPYQVRMSSEWWNKVGYEVRHVLPFLLDNFSAASRTTNVGWFGLRQEMLDLFAQAWSRLGFTGRILVAEDAAAAGLVTAAGVTLVDRQTLLQTADIIVFDIGLSVIDVERTLPPHTLRSFVQSFTALIHEERRRLAAGRPELRRIIGLNAVHGRFEALFTAHVSAGATPLSSRIRHGFVAQPEYREDWLKEMQPGDDGERHGPTIRSVDRAGYFAIGPRKHLLDGVYRLDLGLTLEGNDAPDTAGGFPVLCEITIGEQVIGVHGFAMADLRHGSHTLYVRITEDLMDRLGGFEVRLRTNVPLIVVLSQVLLSRVEEAGSDVLASPASAAATRRMALADGSTVDLLPGTLPDVGEFLPYLALTPTVAVWEGGNIVSEQGHAGYFAYGPHLTAPPGIYEADFDIEVPAGGDGALAGSISIDVLAAKRLLDVVAVQGAQLASGTQRIRFEILPEFAREGLLFRLWTNGAVALRLTRAVARKVADIGEPSVSAADLDAGPWLPAATGAYRLHLDLSPFGFPPEALQSALFSARVETREQVVAHSTVSAIDIAAAGGAIDLRFDVPPELPGMEVRFRMWSIDPQPSTLR